MAIPASSLTSKPSAAPARPSAVAILVTTLATLAGLLLLAAVTSATSLPLFALPFAASAAIVAVAPAAPFAQPRSIMLGHLSAAALALAITVLSGPSIWTAVVAAGLATAPMLLLRAPHPPATATAALIGLTDPDPVFLLNPVLAAGVVVILGGMALGRALPGYRYPAYWR
ncbi:MULTISPECIES: HPP family protein [Streptosporangium]|uniref:CBS-domain-containing membrane protein n=1 Tax=Streptosporangium brasiliense TaxID=47480 RepID=A0ABT9R7D2_9ACTN|nr:HPP family protein [Streptosporangium brasiliense]MDP9864305.1 CBS-domain-containing membrane protein [Streptosporangium brasiliense]